jgi:hypothetical protein
MDEQQDIPTEELEQKIELLESERILLRLAPNVVDRLQKQAEFFNQPLEEFCATVLVESLATSIGKPTISAPSVIGQTIQKKVMGPSTVSTVTRA